MGELAVTVTFIERLHDDSLAASEATVQQHNNFSVLDTVNERTSNTPVSGCYRTIRTDRLDRI